MQTKGLNAICFAQMAATVRICVVRDFKALHYQTATLFIKCFNIQIY